MELKLKPTSVIEAELGIEHGGEVHAFFTNACYKAMDKYVPKSNNRGATSLRKTVDIAVDSITYEMPYAEYQYWGIRNDGTHIVRKYTTPGTGPFWDKRMWSADGERVTKDVQNFINSRGV